MTIYAIEMQHSSDKSRDGTWHEIERHEPVTADDHEIMRKRQKVIELGYWGRPVRLREVAP